VGLEEQAVEWNPFSRQAQDDPYPIYEWLRDEAPCYYNEKTDMWALSRFQDVLEATLDPATFSSSVMRPERGPAEMFIAVDPPRHTPLRNLLSGAFTPRAIRKLQPWIRDVAVRHLDALSDRSEFDLIADFAKKLPLEIICVMLGIPGEDRAELQSLGDRFLARKEGERTPPPDSAVAFEKYVEYFLPVYHERQARPRDDLLTQLACKEFRDTDGSLRTLNEYEFAANGVMLTTAGNETTTKLIGNLAYELWRNPDQRSELCADASLVPNAVEESLRHDAPSQWQNRVAARDVEVHGRKIPSGAFVALISGAAGRDERKYPDPDRFDIHRRIDVHLSLGYGHHVCLGKTLARLEGRIALEELLRRHPEYEVQTSGLERTFSTNVSGYSAMPIETRSA
jgi:cytochrome P450